MKAHSRTLVTFFSLLLSLSVQADELRVAVASNFSATARALFAAFEKQSEHRISASFASSGKLYAQIIHGAPFDLFLSADAERPQQLEQQGQGVSGTRFTYAQGQLALWSRLPLAYADLASALRNASYRYIAIANPKTAPYGIAARELLQKLGLWESLQPRLLRGESVAQAFQYVASGNAQMGLVALAQAQTIKEEVGALWAIPVNAHSPIAQQAILLQKGDKNPAARELLAFLHSTTAMRLIAQGGYALP